MSKILGKITSAEFGTFVDYPFLFGIKLTFKLADGHSIGCGGHYTVNMSPECKWEDQNERMTAIVNAMGYALKILNDAKVNDVSELLDKPVEVCIENGTFKDFRILTEVL